jgi:hypothetical protein
MNAGKALFDASPSRDATDEAELIEAVAAAAKGLRYGSIEVIVHDSRVVQIIRTEKRRLLK